MSAVLMTEALKERLLGAAAKLGQAREREARPSQEENDVGWARCAALIRRGDAAGLERELSELGFLPAAPKGGDGVGLLWMAATGPGAIGFMELARAAAAEPGLAGWERAIGQKLRGGMLTSERAAGNEERSRFSAEPGKTGNGPILAALAADAPEALAQMLCEPGWMEELLACEPPAFEGQWSESASERREQLKESKSALEASLIGAALSARAGGCLALLSEIPEFFQAAAADKLISAELASNPKWRKSQHLFPELRQEEGAIFWGRDKCACPSFFETLLTCEDHSGERRLDQAIDAVIERADPAAHRPQIATGMLWSHMLVARASLWSKQRQAQLMARLSRLSERGFEMGWEALASAAQAQAPELAEWARLQEAALPACKRARAPAL